MSRIFITGSADGLGLMAAKLLVQAGHQVVLHARDKERAAHALNSVPGAEIALTGDLSAMDQTRKLAELANESGAFDAVIHNAGIGTREGKRVATNKGLSQLFAVNTLAPYILTALMHKPKRLVYLSSGLHRGGDATLKDLNWESRPWNGMQAYSDSKLHDAMLACAVARRWPDVRSNAVEPGWVATKMGGAGGSTDIEAGSRTQAWLATSFDPDAMVSGKYFYHQKQLKPEPAVTDTALQDRLIEACANFSGVAFPD